MIKYKSQKFPRNVPQKHLHSRISFLAQAAAYFSTNLQNSKLSLQLAETENGGGLSAAFASTQSRHLLSHLRAVSLKSQIRLEPCLKRFICKRCNEFLVPSKSSTERIKNTSRKGCKPWVDVLVVSCNFCGTFRRFPLPQRGCSKTRAKAKRPSDPSGP